MQGEKEDMDASVMEHDLESMEVLNEELEVVIDWVCMEPGCVYSFPGESIVTGEVIETGEHKALPGRGETNLSHEEKGNSWPENGTGAGAASPEGVQMPILQSLAYDESPGQE